MLGLKEIIKYYPENLRGCIAKNVMSEIINGKRNITPMPAVKLEKALSIKAEFWMRYQVTFETSLYNMSTQFRNRSLV